MFAECIPSGTRRLSSLPSAVLKTLGKTKTLGKIGGLPSVKKTLGKEGSLPSVKNKHSAKRGFAECQLETLGKDEVKKHAA